MSKSDQPLGIVSFLFALSIGFWGNDMVTYIQHLPPDWIFGNVVQSLTLLAGLFFLTDIVCIMWWYGKYIHKIQTTATLGTYFLDFGVCAMFNVAATRWTNYQIFLGATLIGSFLLGLRFLMLYRSFDASDTDRRILRRAGLWLAIAMGICVMALGTVASVILLHQKGPTELLQAAELFKGSFYPFLVICLSGIGIGLTVTFRERIQVSGEMHEYYRRRFVPMELHWPEGLSGDAEARGRIIHSTRRGLERFGGLFRGGPKKLEHDRVRSRVHPEGDLRVQSYILATPSWTVNGQNVVLDDEVEKKAFMVGMSHWIDDLVDGREELDVYKRLARAEGFGLTLHGAEEVFKGTYKDIVVNHTNREFFDTLIQGIENSAQLPENRQYLFFSLNRVAVGSAIFGPKVRYDARQELLEGHNSKVEEMIRNEDPGGRDPWYQDVLSLLTDMRADPDNLGKVLLGLTTKTVQEMAMASEGLRVCFALSVLYSLLYAPLLYFHDVDGELECNEIVPLETFDVSYHAIIPWLQRMRDLIRRDDAPRDLRRDSRLEQLQMAFLCFKPNLPPVAIHALEKVYIISGKEIVGQRGQRAGRRRGPRP
ncbi:MAG: hypothetical protein ACE5JU_20395 [Candidatus Binatia bacterium]